jgi:hypothetical protein
MLVAHLPPPALEGGETKMPIAAEGPEEVSRRCLGVADGIRTRGLQGHNLALYPS